MQIRWTLEALSQLEEIQDYIAEDSPAAAYDVTFQIIDQVETQLSDHPKSGRVGEHFPDTRELVISDVPYIVVYQVRGGAVEVLRVRHTSRLWPPEDDD